MDKELWKLTSVCTEVLYTFYAAVIFLWLKGGVSRKKNSCQAPRLGGPCALGCYSSQARGHGLSLGRWVASAGSDPPWIDVTYHLPPVSSHRPRSAVFLPASLPLIAKLCPLWSAVLISLKLLPSCISRLDLGCSFQAVFSAFPSPLVSYASDTSFSSVLVSCL